MAFLSFFKLLFQKWNICSFYLSCFRFLSIMSFSQKVASSGNVSGCKLTSSVKITLLLVVLDASGLSLWYYCCTIHSSYVGVLNAEWHSRILLLSPNVVRLGSALCDRSGVWKADSGTPLFDWETQLGACLSIQLYPFTEFDLFPCIFCSSPRSRLESLATFLLLWQKQIFW